jgi:hypothetical protein
LPQHPQPAPWPEVATNPLALAVPAAAEPAVRRVEIAGKLKTARGAAVPHSGHVAGCSYSAIGRKSENRPQDGQSYSYFGILQLSQPKQKRGEDRPLRAVDLAIVILRDLATAT